MAKCRFKIMELTSIKIYLNFQNGTAQPRSLKQINCYLDNICILLGSLGFHLDKDNFTKNEE